MDKLWSVLNNHDLFGTEHYETAFIYFNFVIDFELDYKDTYEDIQACFHFKHTNYKLYYRESMKRNFGCKLKMNASYSVV